MKSAGAGLRVGDGEEAREASADVKPASRPDVRSIDERAPI